MCCVRYEPTAIRHFWWLTFKLIGRFQSGASQSASIRATLCQLTCCTPWWWLVRFFLSSSSKCATSSDKLANTNLEWPDLCCIFLGRKRRKNPPQVLDRENSPVNLISLNSSSSFRLITLAKSRRPQLHLRAHLDQLRREYFNGQWVNPPPFRSSSPSVDPNELAPFSILMFHSWAIHQPQNLFQDYCPLSTTSSSNK